MTKGKKVAVIKKIVSETEVNFPIVAIGASAGGLSALEAFFSSIPPVNNNLSISYVIIFHLASDHENLLTEIIKRYSNMPVFKVKNGMVVSPNSVYIIPAHHNMAVKKGILQLTELATSGSIHYLPIDFFFRSLAEDQNELAVGVILSGTGNDGAMGLRAIKGRGGLTIAQDLKTAEYCQMPSNAINAAPLDFILPPAQMPSQINSYLEQVFTRISQQTDMSDSEIEKSLKKVFLLLRGQTGHDFFQYKLSTLLRRIERRMAVHQIKTIEKYVIYLQDTSTEIDALFNDLLITRPLLRWKRWLFPNSF